MISNGVFDAGSECFFECRSEVGEDILKPGLSFDVG